MAGISFLLTVLLGGAAFGGLAMMIAELSGGERFPPRTQFFQTARHREQLLLLPLPLPPQNSRIRTRT
jgi:hypothetical protein